jgi:hypothetical protein
VEIREGGMKVRWWMLSVPVAIMTLASCASAPNTQNLQNAEVLLGGVGALLSVLIAFLTPGGLAGVCRSLPFCTIH